MAYFFARTLNTKSPATLSLKADTAQEAMERLIAHFQPEVKPVVTVRDGILLAEIGLTLLEVNTAPHAQPCI